MEVTVAVASTPPHSHIHSSRVTFSALSFASQDSFTGNKKLFNAKLNAGGKVDAARRGGADMDGARSVLENDSVFAEGNDGFGASRG